MTRDRILIFSACVGLSIPCCGGGGAGRDGYDKGEAGSPWSTAVAIHGLAGSSVAPQVVVDRLGHGIAVWRQVGGEAQSELWAVRYDAAGNWKQPTRISTSEASFSEHTLAGDESGNAVVAWIEIDVVADVTAVRVSRYVPGEGWMAPRSLVTLPIADGALSSVRAATSAEGIATVVWRRDDALTQEESLWSREYQPASGWLDEHAVAFGDLYDAASAAQIVLDSTGRALIVWARVVGDEVEIQSRRGSAVMGSLGAVGWEAAQLVASLSIGSLPSSVDGELEGLWTGIDDSGKAFVAWLHGESGQLELSVAFASLTGAWSNPQSSGRVIDLGPGLGYYASVRVASASVGSLRVVWRQGLAGASRLVTKHFDEANGWTEVEIIADQLREPCADCADTHYFDLSVDAAGNALVVWEERIADGQLGIWASRHAPGSTWERPSGLTSGSSFPSQPVVTLSPAGTGIALWPQIDAASTQTRVWASHFSSN